MSDGDTRSDGRRERFERAANAVYEPLQRFARRRSSPDVADDVVAETLLVLWRRLDEVIEGAELPWCYGVARRVLGNHQRSETRRRRLIGRLSMTTPPDSIVDLPREMDPTADSELQTALAHLSAADREVLTMWAWETLEPRDLAVALGVSVNAATIRLHRAKRRLRRDLDRRKSSPPTGQATRGHTEHE